MAAYGWVFGCHTYAHKDLTKMTAGEIKESMEKVDASFLEQGYKKPAIAAFPFGKYNQKVIEAMKPYRKQMRKAYYEDKLIDLKTWILMRSIAQAPTCVQQKAQRQGKAGGCRLRAKKSHRFPRPRFLFRKAGRSGRIVVETKASLFEELVQYCVKKGCLFVTMEESWPFIHKHYKIFQFFQDCSKIIYV